MKDDIITLVQKKFNIHNLKTCILGGTIVTFNPYAGCQNACDSTLNKNSLLNFAELSSLEKEQGNPFDNLGLSTIWNVGFSSVQERISPPDYFSGNSIKYLKNRKIKTTDQLFSRRSESSTASLFSCFKIKGSNYRSITEESSTIALTSDNEEYKKFGFICNNWLESPQTIEYVVNIKGSESAKDYLYFIGGDSNESFLRNPQIEFDRYRSTYKKLVSESDLNLNKNLFGNNDRVIYSSICGESNIWKELDPKTIDIKRGTEIFNQAMLIRHQYRYIQAIYNLYNYLLHAHKQLHIQNINEVSQKDDEVLFKSVKIEDLIKKYEPYYRFCKNIELYSL